MPHQLKMEAQIARSRFRRRTYLWTRTPLIISRMPLPSQMSVRRAICKNNFDRANSISFLGNMMIFDFMNGALEELEEVCHWKASRVIRQSVHFSWTRKTRRCYNFLPVMTWQIIATPATTLKGPDWGFSGSNGHLDHLIFGELFSGAQAYSFYLIMLLFGRFYIFQSQRKVSH